MLIVSNGGFTTMKLYSVMVLRLGRLLLASRHQTVDAANIGMGAVVNTS